MADLQTPRVPLTVYLPSELIDELREVAGRERLSVDEIVVEACLAYTEPRLWEHDYKKGQGHLPQ
jgi:hypothetical protein